MFRRSILSDRQEAAVQKTLQNLRAQRRNRFRILACIDGTEESLVTVRFAARFCVQDNCDLIVLYRPAHRFRACSPAGCRSGWRARTCWRRASSFPASATSSTRSTS